MKIFKPYPTLALGVVLGAIVWPMVKGRIPNIGA